MIPKFITSQATAQLLITIHNLPNISRSKNDQAMKFGQLIECKKNKYNGIIINKNKIYNISDCWPRIMLNFYTLRFWDWSFHHILCMIFQEKYFSFYILSTDQILLSGSLYLLRYWTIYLYCNYLLSSLWRHKFWN